MHDHVVEAHPTGTGALQELLLGCPLAGKEIERQGFGPLVDQGDGAPQVGNREHGQQRPEQLLLHQGVVEALHGDQGGGDPAPADIALATPEDLPPLAGALQQPRQALELAVVHDRGQVGGVQGSAAEAGCEPLLHLADQGLADPLLHQQVVGRDAGLSGVEGLAPHQAPRRHRQVGVSQHHGWAFPPQLQGHGGEVLGRGGHHQSPHPLAACEKDVIELLLQQRLGRVAIAQHHLHGVRGEGGGDQIGDHLRGGRRLFRRLQHGGVTRRQGTHQRLDAEVERVVPGADDQHAAQGFTDHLRGAGLEAQGHAHPAWGHPAPQLPAAELDLLLHGHQLEVGLNRWLAQVVGEGGQHRIAVGAHSPLQPVQLGQAPGQRACQPGAHRLAQGGDRREGWAGHHGGCELWVGSEQPPQVGEVTVVLPIGLLDRLDQVRDGFMGQ